MNRSPGSWRRLNSRCVYDNPWIRVRHEEVLTPAGTEGIYGVVHFKNIAVGVVPLDGQGNTWLVRQSRYPLGESTWEIPEGGCPEQEDTRAAALRELREEVGLDAGQLELLQRLQLSNSVTDETAVIYVARELTSVPQALEDSEDIEVRKLPLTEAIAMVERGDITDAISVAALLRLACRS